MGRVHRVRCAERDLQLSSGRLSRLDVRLHAVRPGQVVAGALLVIVSLVSFTGRRPTFVLGAVLSAAVLVTLALSWGTYATNDSIAAAVISLASLAVDAVASSPSKELSERDSPLNLPVFG